MSTIFKIGLSYKWEGRIECMGTVVKQFMGFIHTLYFKNDLKFQCKVNIIIKL